MLFYSTNKKSRPVSFRAAVLQGLADDGGLFMPQTVKPLKPGFVDSLQSRSQIEISFEVTRAFVEDELAEDVLLDVLGKSMTFDAPLVQLAPRLSVLELFHGPTMAFKDFGAQFMARLMGQFVRELGQELIILVATSGDTGGAVACAFHQVPGIRVVVLYPGGRVSEIQERQFATLGGNISALEVKGGFDDCQALVKAMLADRELNAARKISSANSINISRLIPQIFYYFRAWAQLERPRGPVVVSVPSGNFGNLTAGLFAGKMGLPVGQFIAATNSNDVVPKYLQTGVFQARESERTLSTAMDVGRPSNFARMLDLYAHSLESMRRDICGESFTDVQTREAIKNVYQRYNYVLDPHSAVAYLGISAWLSRFSDGGDGVFLATAHPAKFAEIVQPLIAADIGVPQQLARCMNETKSSVKIENDRRKVKDFLQSL